MADPVKREVRARLRAARREIAATRDRGADDAALADAVSALLERHSLGPGSTVSLYEARPEEPPTAGMLAALRARGVRVLLPLTMADLDLDWADAADPAATPLGLEAIGEVDLVLIPGLAVDASGVRLGQGGGCYDKALPRRRPGQQVTVILHPEEFTTEALPHEDHDVRVDAVLTAEGVSEIRRE